MKKNKKILLGVTGSIAAYKAADIIRRLQDKSIEVTVVMTKEAEAFITPLTLATLSKGKVFREMFAVDQDAWDMEHIALSEAADLLLIAPATANIIGKIANGIADDLLTCLAMTVQKPLLIAPAMNKAMWQNKIVQANCVQLKKTGVTFIGPVKGPLACGDEGTGRLADVKDIVAEVIRSLKLK